MDIKILKGKEAQEAFARAMSDCFEQLGEHEQDAIIEDIIAKEESKKVEKLS